MGVSRPADILCFSHLGWDLVFQRPNHLMVRAARDRRVFYVEEPHEAARPSLAMRVREGGVVVVTPGIPARATGVARESLLRELIDALVRGEGIERPRRWYYTPLALPWSDHVPAETVVYDCMDELTGFRNAPQELHRLEPELLARADIVFTGGHGLYDAKRRRHHNVHAFPSAVDVGHFARARGVVADPDDQAPLGRPRIGYYGVIDERMDLDLLRAIARARPAWSIVLIGPIVKISTSDIPALRNIYWLGPKPYAQLPAYLGGWDVAIMPFAHNDATAFISPTKTPEYLAGGRPVVSTAIRDVVKPYGEKELARIADTPRDFVAAIEAALVEDRRAAQAAADAFLAGISWDRTWCEMDELASRAGRSPLAVVERLMVGAPASSALPLASSAAASHVSPVALRSRAE